MGRHTETEASGTRIHLVTVEPVRGCRRLEHVWCTCGAEGDFPVDGLLEDWALLHPAEQRWLAAKAS